MARKPKTAEDWRLMYENQSKQATADAQRVADYAESNRQLVSEYDRARVVIEKMLASQMELLEKTYHLHHTVDALESAVSFMLGKPTPKRRGECKGCGCDGRERS